jgi:hypothetical protein
LNMGGSTAEEKLSVAGLGTTSSCLKRSRSLSSCDSEEQMCMDRVAARYSWKNNVPSMRRVKRNVKWAFNLEERFEGVVKRKPVFGVSAGRVKSILKKVAPPQQSPGVQEKKVDVQSPVSTLALAEASSDVSSTFEDVCDGEEQNKPERRLTKFKLKTRLLSI